MFITQMIFPKLLACLLSLSILAVPAPRKNRQSRLRIKSEST